MHILATDSLSNVPGSGATGQGGPSRLSAHLSQAAKKAGHRYTGVITQSYHTDITQPKMRFLTKNAQVQYILFKYPFAISRAVSKATQKKNPHVLMKDVIQGYREIIRKTKPDVVLLNGFDHSVWAFLVAAHEENIPVVARHAGIWHKEIDAYADWYPAAATAIMKGMEKDLAKYTTKQVFLNEYSENVFQKVVAKSPKAKRHVITLPTAFKQPKKRVSKKSGIIAIGMVARWDRIKNHAAVLALAEAIKKQNAPMQIHVVTSLLDNAADKAMKDRYRSLIKVHPPMKNHRVLSFFKKMDIAILPSHFETAAFVVAEAASQGIGTIISPNVGWVSHYRSTGNAKWVDGFKQPKKLIKKISALAGKPLSTKLLKRMEHEQDPKTVTGQYLTLFESLVN